MFKAIKYNSNDINTDFEYLIKNKKNSLFIYNENVEAWKNKSTTEGGGNAIVRPYRADIGIINYNQNFSLGIPTAYFKTKFYSIKNINYIESNETQTLLEIIDISINNIDKFIANNKQHINTIYWSADDDNLIGLSLFKNKFYNQSIALIFQTYITNKLKEIALKYNYQFIL